MNKSEVVSALNLDLEYEMSSIIRYLHHAFMVKGPLRGPLVELFRQKAIASMDHAVTLGDKITALGGHPSVRIQKISDDHVESGVEEMLRKDLAAEERHLELYAEHLDLVKDDTPLRVMIEQFVMEEASHIEELEMYLRTPRN